MFSGLCWGLWDHEGAAVPRFLESNCAAISPGPVVTLFLLILASVDVVLSVAECVFQEIPLSLEPKATPERFLEFWRSARYHRAVDEQDSSG
eukprot:6060684-Amphidinium_carterae.1